MRTKPKIFLGISTPMLLLLLVGGVSVYSIRSIVATEEWVDHTNVVMAKASATIASALDMETGMRGYLLAGDESFLVPYLYGGERTFGSIRSLQDEVSDNPRQVERLAEAAGILREWQKDVALPMIALRAEVGDSSTMDELAARVGEARGKQHFDRFRLVMASFLSEETQLLADRRTKNTSTIDKTFALIAIVVFVTVSASFLLAWLIGNGIANPIVQMTKVMKKLASGNTSMEIPGSGRSDEIGDMGNAVEVFRKSLDKNRAADIALRDKSDELESRVFELEEARKDLALARDEAETANRAKSEFLAAMSHELRTPLNAIIGFSEMIRDETFGPVGSVKYREYTNDIHGAGLHLLDLINDILDLAKIEAGRDELAAADVDIDAVIRSAMVLVGQRAEHDGIKLVEERMDQLPALHADERKLKQILVNLLSNAIKFTDAGGTVTMRTWCRRDTGHVFQISDTGIGIAPEDIPKALSRFGQVDGDLSRQFEGSGLGLPLTKALVEQHGGVLDLRSEVGSGTTVTVRFPVERVVSNGATFALGENAQPTGNHSDEAPRYGVNN